MKNFKICQCCMNDLHESGFAKDIYKEICIKYVKKQSPLIVKDHTLGEIFRFLELKGYITSSECQKPGILFVKPNSVSEELVLFCRGHKETRERIDINH